MYCGNASILTVKYDLECSTAQFVSFSSLSTFATVCVRSLISCDRSIRKEMPEHVERDIDREEECRDREKEEERKR